MATPTGYKFSYNGVSTDFADVFIITNPVGSGSQTTYYTSSAYSNLDLGKIFVTGNSGITTNYLNNIGQDLGSIFTISPYVTTGTVNKTSDGTYNTILTWTTNGTIIFNKNAIIGTPPEAIITGGGAGGEVGSEYGGVGGRGGGGAPPTTVIGMSYPTLSTTYTITIGSGGKGGTYDAFNFFPPISGSSSVFTYTSTYTGNGGTIYLGGAGGAPNTAGTNGLNNSGGGGGGGSSTSTVYLGGNGGPSGGGAGGNGGVSGGGSGGKGSAGQNGLQPGGGGGGGGSNGQNYSPPQPAYALGGNGASGSIVFKFNI